MKESELLYKLGQKIKQLRSEKNWTLRELEAYTNIDHSDLSKMESGYISPQILTLYKISQAFGITLSQLVDIEERSDN